MAEGRGQQGAANRRASESRDGGIDAGLLLLLAVTPRGVTWTTEEIAYVCGCSRSNIWLIEQRALRKLRRNARLKGWL